MLAHLPLSESHPTGETTTVVTSLTTPLPALLLPTILQSTSQDSPSENLFE
jgi:hypothetical protein